MAADILFELVSGRVAAIGLLADGDTDHSVEVARDAAYGSGGLRAAAGEQLAEEHTEGVDIRRFGDALAAELLRAGVLGSHGGRHGDGAFGDAVPGIEELGDAEI